MSEPASPLCPSFLRLMGRLERALALSDCQKRVAPVWGASYEAALENAPTRRYRPWRVDATRKSLRVRREVSVATVLQFRRIRSEVSLPPFASHAVSSLLARRLLSTYLFTFVCLLILDFVTRSFAWQEAKMYG